MNTATLEWETQEGAPPALGPGVFGQVKRLKTGANVRIGLPQDSSFRRLAGVQIDVDELILEDGVVIEREVSLRGGRIHLGRGVRIKSGATVSAIESVFIGAGGVVGEDCEIAARRVSIGRQLWMLPFAKIGGGSAMEVDAELIAGPWLHLGMYSLVNTAKPVNLGREIGLGTRTSLYTHGAYPSMLRDAPVAYAPISIGDYSWLPGATVNPGVNIGKHCVVGVNSLVTRDVPDGSLVGGSPAKTIKVNAYPRKLSEAETDKKMRAFLADYARILTDKHVVTIQDATDELRVSIDSGRVSIVWKLNNDTGVGGNEIRLGLIASGGRLNISLVPYTVTGIADADTLRLINQLRRYGVRFDVEPIEGQFVAWQD